MDQSWKHQLGSAAFADYAQAVATLQGQLDLSLDSAEVELLLRVYDVYRHGYTDIADLAAQVQKALDEQKPENDPALQVAHQYLTGLIDAYASTSGTPPEGTMPGHSMELGGSIYAKRYGEVCDGSSDAAKLFASFDALMEEIEATRHRVYHILRRIGADHTRTIAPRILGLNAVDQAFILHALDAFPGDSRVLGFYDAYIDAVSDPSLKQLAAKYRSRVAVS